MFRTKDANLWRAVTRVCSVDQIKRITDITLSLRPEAPALSVFNPDTGDYVPQEPAPQERTYTAEQVRELLGEGLYEKKWASVADYSKWVLAALDPPKTPEERVTIILVDDYGDDGWYQVHLDGGARGPHFNGSLDAERYAAGLRAELAKEGE